MQGFQLIIIDSRQLSVYNLHEFQYDVAQAEKRAKQIKIKPYKGTLEPAYK